MLSTLSVFCQTILTLNDPEEEDFRKTLWEKEKMLVTSIFSFSHNVFYPIRYRNHCFSNLKFVVCKCFEFGPVRMFVVCVGGRCLCHGGFTVICIIVFGRSCLSCMVLKIGMPGTFSLLNEYFHLRYPTLKIGFFNRVILDIIVVPRENT